MGIWFWKLAREGSVERKCELPICVVIMACIPIYHVSMKRQ